jgi:hypothetical protein
MRRAVHLSKARLQKPLPGVLLVRLGKLHQHGDKPAIGKDEKAVLIISGRHAHGL